ncbi:hypothetical protein G7054_g9454 [Neopestalotiopsis clavispora]|nr:hypothetical protein G7054_g9454 [Neopestalotiopsis clavispora]
MPLGGKGPATIGVLCIETAISGLCVGGRYFTRRILQNNPGYDDTILLASWIFMVAFAVLFTISSMYGFGQHVDALEREDIKMATLIELCGQFMVSLAMGLSKTGVALFLMRIITNKWQIAVLWGWIVIMMALSILLAVSCFAQCYPVQSLWDADVTIEACPINLTKIAFVMCSFSAAMDFFLALCPYYALKDLNMKRKEKWTIIISLSLGIFAGAFGIVRTVGLGVLSETADYLYATADSVMYTSTELTLTLVCVSLPIFRPLVRRLSSYYSYDRTDTKERSGAGYQSQRVTLERMRSAKVNPRTASDAEVGLDFLPAEGARKSSCNDDASNGLYNIWRQDSSSTKSIPRQETWNRPQAGSHH